VALGLRLHRLHRYALVSEQRGLLDVEVRERLRHAALEPRPRDTAVRGGGQDACGHDDHGDAGNPGRELTGVEVSDPLHGQPSVTSLRRSAMYAQVSEPAHQAAELIAPSTSGP